MATHCQTDMWGGGGECQNLGVVNFFEGQKEGWSTSNCEPNNGSQCSKLRLYFVHLPGANTLKMVHPAICSCVTHYVNISKI